MIVRILIFCLLFPLSALGEKIKPRCTLSNRESKPVITVIRPILFAETRYISPGNHEVCFPLKIKTVDLIRNEMVPINKNLYDSSGEIVAFAAADFFPHKSPTKIDSIFSEIWIRGTIPYFALVPESLFEIQLEKIINSAKKEMTLSDLSAIFKKFLVKSDTQTGNYVTYGLHESYCFFPQKKYRVFFIFDGENLVSIIYLRKLTLKYFESQASSSPYNIYFMKKMNQEEKKKLTDLFLQSAYR